jgi:hypothetical protein
VAAAKNLTLHERVLQIDHIQARRFAKLSGEAIEIASEGIIRHLRACARMDVNPDASAVREIIDDALNGRRVFAETSNDLLAA